MLTNLPGTQLAQIVMIKEVLLVLMVGDVLLPRKLLNITAPELFANVTKVWLSVCTNTGLTGTNPVIVSGQNPPTKVSSSSKTDASVVATKSMNLLAKVTITNSSAAVNTPTLDLASQPETTTENTNAALKITVPVLDSHGTETCLTSSLNAVKTTVTLVLLAKTAVLKLAKKLINSDIFSSIQVPKQALIINS